MDGGMAGDLNYGVSSHWTGGEGGQGQGGGYERGVGISRRFNDEHQMEGKATCRG